MTGRELQNLWIAKLTGRYEEREIKQIFSLWLEVKHQVDRLNWLTHMDEEWVGEFNADLQRLTSGEPIQYILGVADFFGFTLKVNSNVLIPRPESEDLVRLVGKDAKPNATILDIGTGSGCIALALKKLNPAFDVAGLDVSSNALLLAAENGESLGLDVSWHHSDIMNDSLPNPLTNIDWNVIVSNPPYIRESESTSMEPHVVEHEPNIALFVPDEDGLLFYRRIADLASSLNKVPDVYFECHTEHTKSVALLMTDRGWSQVDIHQDFTGKPRFVSAKTG